MVHKCIPLACLIIVTWSYIKQQITPKPKKKHKVGEALTYLSIQAKNA